MTSGSICANAALTLLGLRSDGQQASRKQTWQFQMPLHYPRYKKGDYETMPEWKVDCLLKEYGLPAIGDVAHKRQFAMDAFLWPSQK